MSRPLLAAAAAALLAGVAGCASLIPVGPILSGMKDEDVDVVVAKVIERYPQVARLIASESIVIVLDSVVVPSRGGEAWKDDEAKLVSTIASYMLGEEIGRDWTSRIQNERLVMGEGEVFLAVYRSPDGKRYLLDGAGMFGLLLPQASAGGKTGAIESLSFDLKIANQAFTIAPEGGTVELLGEIIPRTASYVAGGTVFKRWANALYHLGWDVRAGGTNGAGPGPRPPPGGDAAIAAYLENTRAFVGPVVRLRVKFERGPDGFHRFAQGSANAVELVLPSALVSGDRALEDAVARMGAAFPGRFVRRESELFIKVGYFFFHADPTGATSYDAAARQRAAEMKRFRIPDVK